MNEYEGQANSLTDFVYDKLHPMLPAITSADPPGRVWRPTARRHDVLLPKTSPEMYSAARLLAEAAERELRDDQYDLLVVVKINFLHGSVTHQTWERGRWFARQVTDRFGVAVIVAQHVPALAGGKNPAAPHLHLMITPRRPEAIGFTAFNGVTTASAHKDLAAMWAACRDADLP